ncbi:hypothetical protein LXL04_003798 [Taraxacum kok-saghyz]
MAPPLYVFVPPAAVVKAPNTPTAPLIITSNNVAFSPVIPDKLQDQGLEVFLHFLQAHPLRYAFADIPTFYPKHICEFYYSCTFNPQTHSIHGTIADGTQHVIITPAIIRNAVRLPIFHEYPPYPNEAECIASLPLISYNLARQGTQNENFTLRQCLPTGWKLVTGIIGKCLGHKTGSLDQLNLFELRILHALVANRIYDFTGLIFDHLVATISGNARPTYVTFPSFIGLFLQHIGDGYAGEPEDERPCSMMSPRLFSTAPQVAEPRPVNFVPIMVQPLAAQHPDPAAQPAGEAQPQPYDEATTTADASSSSPERQSPIHHSPAPTTSGNTSPVHLTQSEADTNFSHPSSESPLISPLSPNPINQHIPPRPSTPHTSPSQGESHHTIPSHVSPIPQNTEPQEPVTDFQSTILHLLQTMNQRLYLLETDVAAIKNHLIPDPSIHHNSPPPPPPPPPSGQPPRQSTPPRQPREASHVSDSLTQSDAKGEKSTAEGEQNQQIALVEGESQQQPTQAEGEHSKQLAEDSLSSSSDDEEGFLDTSFLQEDLLSLVAGEASDVESDDEGHLQTCKRKQPTADPAGAGPSNPPKKKRRTIKEIAADWGMSVEEARILSVEHILALKNIAIEAADADVVKYIAAEEGGEATQLETLHQFEAADAKKQKISKVLDQMDAKRYAGVQHKSFNPDPIIRVSELQKYGLSEWLQIQEIIVTHQGIHALELKVALNQLIEKCQRLKLIPAPQSKTPSAGTSSAAPRRSKSKHIPFLLPYGTRYINNTPPTGVEPVQYKFIRFPEHGMFYMDANFQMCFQRTSELPAAQTEHLYHLRLECIGHPKQEGFYKIISVELERRTVELLVHEEMYWMKDEILSDAEKARLEALVD